VTWDALRKDARRLEQSIDSKLLSFSKIDVSPSDASADALEREIGAMISELAAIHSAMVHHLQADVETHRNIEHGSIPLSHQLEKHRETLQAYTDDFKRARSARKQRQEREQLLPSVRVSIREHQSASGILSTGQRALAKEERGLHNANTAAEGLFSTATATLDRLHRQRGLFGTIESKVKTFAAKFPVINNVMGRIQRRKTRDMLIMAFLISSFIIFILWWAR